MVPIPFIEMWNLLSTLQYADRDNAENAWREITRTASHRNICVITLCSVVQPVIQQLEERLPDFIKHRATELNLMVRFI